jgi:signal transduction histidine kinase
MNWKLGRLGSKLIAINVILIGILFVSQYLFQNVFLEKNYASYKKDKLLSSIEQYSSIRDDSKMLKAFKENLLERQNLTIFEMDSKFDTILGQASEMNYIDIKKEDGEIVRVETLFGREFFDSLEEGMNIEANAIEVEKNKKLLAVNLKLDDEVKSAFYTEETFYVEFSGEDDWIKSIQENDLKNREMPVVNIEATVIKGSVVAFKNTEGNLTRHNQIIQYYTKTKNLKGVTQKLDKIKYAGSEYLIGIKASDFGYITAITTVKPSRDIVDMFNDFNKYLIIVGVTSILGLIILYKKIITNPLSKINEVSQDIAVQNFENHLNIKTGDELETISNTINEMSDNLNENIENLKNAKMQIQKDYEKRIEIEENQKFLLMNISHDLKTPLTIVKGNLKAIKDGIYDMSYIEPTIDGVDEITNTLNEMLELTKIQSVGLNLRLELSDLGRLIYKVYDEMRGLANEKNIRVEFDVEETFIMMDEREMKKVIQNLISNAIKYSPRNESILIKTHKIKDGFKFTIENTGVNIEEKAIDNIFDPFYRGDFSRDSKTKGNGLGLSIVKAVLDAHGYECSIYNREKSVVVEVED